MFFQLYKSKKNVCIWAKNNWTSGDLSGAYAYRYEFVIYAVKGRPKLNGYRLNDIWLFDRVAGKDQLHQNQKPVALLSQIIDKSSKRGDLVFDPFMGTGTTLVAAENLGRNSIGIELSAEYCEIARARLAHAAGEGNEMMTEQTKTPVNYPQLPLAPLTLF